MYSKNIKAHQQKTCKYILFNIRTWKCILLKQRQHAHVCARAKRVLQHVLTELTSRAVGSGLSAKWCQAAKAVIAWTFNICESSLKPKKPRTSLSRLCHQGLQKAVSHRSSKSHYLPLAIVGEREMEVGREPFRMKTLSRKGQSRKSVNGSICENYAHYSHWCLTERCTFMTHLTTCETYLLTLLWWFLKMRK